MRHFPSFNAVSPRAALPLAISVVEDLSLAVVAKMEEILVSPTSCARCQIAFPRLNVDYILAFRVRTRDSAIRAILFSFDFTRDESAA